MRHRRSYTFALVAAGAALLACAGDGDQMRAPTDVSVATNRQLSATTTPSASTTATARPDGLLTDLLGGGQPLPLFVCQNNGGPYTDSAVVGVFGGVLHIGPHALIIPPAALLTPTSIKATT